MVAVFACVIAINGAQAQNTPTGSCEASTDRVLREIEFIVESRTESETLILAKAPCTNAPIAIRRCAVTQTRNLRIQRYCNNPNQPTYAEEVDIVEYWGAEGEQPSPRK